MQSKISLKRDSYCVTILKNKILPRIKNWDWDEPHRVTCITVEHKFFLVWKR
jgi:hypothetical protein